MKNNKCHLLVLIAMGCFTSVALAQVMPVTQISPVKLKVSKRQKTDSRETFRTTDGSYRALQNTQTIHYSVDLTNVSGGPAKEFLVKWSVLLQQSFPFINSEGQTTNVRIVQGEKTLNLDFAKSASFDTDDVEISTSETKVTWGTSSKFGGKLLGYAVEVFCNDRCVAADIQPPNVKSRLEQASAASEQKRHKF